MKSVYDELNERIAEDPRLTRRGGPRIDVGLLLMNYEDDLRDHWAAVRLSIAYTKKTLAPSILA